MHGKKILGALAALLLLTAADGRTQTLGDVTFHGFVSQGYLKSTDNNWLTAPTAQGSFAFTEAALNFTVEPASRLRIGAQFYARDLGVQGNNNVILDWAVGDYRFRDWLGIRAGKVKLPLGLYTIVVDNPVARPEIIMPAGIYPLSTRDLANTIQGFDVYGTVNLAGEIEYEVWVGTIGVDESPLIERLLNEGVQDGLPFLGLQQPYAIVADIEPNVRIHYGGAFQWRPPIQGLRLKVSGSYFDADVANAVQYSGYQGPIPVAFTARSQVSYEQEYALIFSGEYERGGLLLAAEYYKVKNNIATTQTGLPGPPVSVERTQEPLSWYVKAAYRFDDTWQAGGYYSVNYVDDDDRDGQRFVLMGQPAYRGWLKQWTFTGRADINRHWLLKAEVSLMDGAATVSPLDNPDGLVQDWTLFALQTVVHF